MMSKELADLLDLHLAWRRVKNDIFELKRVFVRHPYEIKLIEHDLDKWLNSLLEKIRNGDYNPSPMHICDVPKEKGLIRPGSQLSLQDQVVYAACLDACFPFVHKTLSWAQGTVDFSYILSDPQNHQWFRNRFKGWEDFRNKSISKIDDGISYVVIADITGYYENIDINLLISDLKLTGAPTQVTNLLSKCLNRWAQISGRGIPQGLSASDILGKLYLNTIDEQLKNMGIFHYRYVDDIRLFCKSISEAKKALLILTRLLRKRGLNLQAAKSNIYRADSAREIIVGAADTIAKVNKKYIDSINDILNLGDHYNKISRAEKEYENNPDNAPIEVIKETFKAYFIDSTEKEFETSLFRFLLNRLGKRKDKYALDYCKQLFIKQPHVTDVILNYIAACNAYEDIEESIIAFIKSDEAVYPYQIYQIIEWISEQSVRPNDTLIEICRRLAFDDSQPYYLKFICMKIIGDYGAISDLELLEESYRNARNSLEQSIIICCLKRMEKGRRNAFLSRAEKDGDLNRCAVIFVKSQNL